MASFSLAKKRKKGKNGNGKDGRRKDDGPGLVFFFFFFAGLLCAPNSPQCLYWLPYVYVIKRADH